MRDSKRSGAALVVAAILAWTPALASDGTQAPEEFRPFTGRIDAPDKMGGYRSDAVLLRLAAGRAVDAAGLPGVAALSPALDQPPRNLALAERHGLTRLYTATLHPGVDARRAVTDLSATPGVERAELIGIGGVLATTPDDPDFGLQYGLLNTGQTIAGVAGTPGADINASEAWDLTTGEPDVKIAIVDTGVSQSHPDLQTNVLPGYSPLGASWDDDIFISHGTHCAGIAGGDSDNAMGIAGVGWDCSILPVKVLGFLGSGTEPDIAAGVVWAADNGADVISMSLGSPDFGTVLENVVVGDLSTMADGNTRARYHVFDVVNERRMLSDEVTGNRQQWRDMAHHISDQVFEAITGIRGAFSTKIVYVLAKNAGSPSATYAVEVADSDGERSRNLFTSDQPVMSPSWSPDGRKVAYVSFETGRPGIVIQDLASGERELVTQFSGINGSPSFSPDGRSLLMVLSQDGNPEIYLMTLDDRRLRRLTRHHAIDTEPSFTPDGQAVVFTSDRGGAPQIYRLELATNLVERLTFQGGYNARARVLPDGQHLVYVHRSDRGVFHIAWQDLARDDVRVLTSTSLDESPSLAPNGTMLIYATQDRGRGILGVVSIDGRVKYRLPSSSGDVREPAWSPYLSFQR